MKEKVNEVRKKIAEIAESVDFEEIAEAQTCTNGRKTEK